MLNVLEQEVRFRQSLNQADNALSQDPDGQLTLPWRNALWLAMGMPQEDKNGYPTGSGWRRRVRLSLLTVRHILPIWQKEYPDDQGPQRMLLLAEQVLEGKADRNAAGPESDNYWAAVSDLGVMEEDAEPAKVLPFMVGAAAARVVRTARIDYQMVLSQDPDADPTELDTDRDPWMWDESYLGAMAYAGGAAWLPSSSPERRREFWRWWLEVGAPQAYQSVLE